MQVLSAVQSLSAIQACSAIQVCNGITVIAGGEEVVPFTNTYSVDFDGTDDYATIADANDLSFGNGSTDSAFSILAWVKMDDATKFRIVSKTNSTSDAEWFLTTSGSDKLRIDLLDADNNNRIGIETDAAITAHEGSWISVIATYDGGGDSSTMVLYINGVAQATSAIDAGSYTAMHNTAAPVWIGGLAYGPDFANGKIDEVAIIPSELSAAQVTAIYNSGEPADLTSYSPTLWTRFEEGTGTSIADSSGNGHTATLTNGPTFSTDVPVAFTNTYAVDFNGIDQYLTIPTLKPYTEIGTGDFTLSFRIKFGTITGITQRFLYIGRNTLDGVSAADFCYLALNTSGYLQLFWRTGNQGVGSGTWESALSDSQYYHIVVTRTGTTSKLYVDDIERISITDAEVGTALGASGSDTEIIFATFRDASSNFTDCKIDEIALWKSLLTTEQLTTIHNSGSPRDLKSLSPFTWLRMGENDGGTGTTITDQGSGGNNGTLTNGPTFSTDVPT